MPGHRPAVLVGCRLSGTVPTLIHSTKLSSTAHQLKRVAAARNDRERQVSRSRPKGDRRETAERQDVVVGAKPGMFGNDRSKIISH
jgi:hypothetical protein